MHSLVLSSQPLVLIRVLKVVDKSTLYVHLYPLIGNSLLFIKNIKVWWRKALEVNRRITLFSTRIKQFNVDQDVV